MSQGALVHEEPLVGQLEADAQAPLSLARRTRWRIRKMLGSSLLARTLSTTFVLVLSFLLVEPEATRQHVSLPAIGVIVAIIWFLCISWTAHATHGRRLGWFTGPLIGAAVSVGAISFFSIWVLDDLVQVGDLAVIAASGFALLVVWYALVTRTLRARARVTVVGLDDDTRSVVLAVQDAGRTAYRLVGILDDGPEDRVAGVPVVGPTADLLNQLRRNRHEVVVVSRSRYAETVNELLDAGYTGARILDPFEFHERALQRVNTDRISAAWFGSLLDRQPGRSSAVAKRSMDLVISAFGLVFMLPLLGAVALAVRLSSPGPVLFRQTRVGEGGQEFQILKFRSMVADAEATGAVWASERDPRITRVGHILRQSRLDELPQLWNVLKGEMSIVGPRPERPEFIAMLSASLPSWSRRHLLKPGITGWAQVQYSYTDDISGAATKLSYDLYYLKHRDAALDVMIMCKTFGVMLSRFGSR